VLRTRWRRGRRAGGYRGVSQVIATVLLVTLTVVLMIFIYLIKFPLPNPPPQISYDAENDAKYPVWGDPTDCYPNYQTLTVHGVVENWQYFLSNGTGNTTDRNRYSFYMDMWGVECDNVDVSKDNGTYNTMDAARIIVTGVSQQIPLSALQFEFNCVNTTPTYQATQLVAGHLDAMEWVPGGDQTLSPLAPKLGTCASYSPQGNGANQVYYNRLGFFDPLNTTYTYLTVGMTIVIYVHTPGSITEAPSTVEDQSKWGQSDTDDYHGAPLWCFTTPGSCTVELVDTAWSPAVVVLTAPVYML
jgi:hypothetical protein